MKTLNLAQPEKTEIQFQISRFPDGQQSISLNGNENLFNEKTETVVIKSRFNSFRDLELIILANQILKQLGISHVELYVPYFLGARSDRRFEQYSINYLKTVICPIINLQKFNKVIVMDPHSDVLEACLDNFESVPNFGIVQFALVDYFVTVLKIPNADYTNVEFVSPDAGSLKKVYAVAENMGFQKDIIIASKHRDITTGNITHTEVSNIPEGNDKSFFIFDDICDGGRTFIELAKAIRLQRPKADFNDKIYLVITHGIFSAGLKSLNEVFDGIYTTDSINAINNAGFSLANDNEMYKLKIQSIF